MLKEIIDEPLLQFFSIALLLVLLVDNFSTEALMGKDQFEIHVTTEKLENFLQFRSKRFRADEAAYRIDTMTADEKRNLVGDFVRSEVLYREAIKRSMDKNDEVVRRRLIQKMEYISQGFYSDLPPIKEADVIAYFGANLALYQQPEKLSFTHVFFPFVESNQLEQESVLEAAKVGMNRMNFKHVPFEKASQNGERFMFNRNYIERDESYVTSHFGLVFSKEIFQYAAEPRWQGPIKSRYGYHVVMLRSKTPKMTSDVGTVGPEILASLRRTQLEDHMQKNVGLLIDKYQVKNELGP